MDKNKQPGISFDNIILVRESFHRTPEMPETLSVNVDFDMNCYREEEQFFNELSVTLTCTDGEDDKDINDVKKEVLRLEGTFVGFFSIIKGQENMEMKEYLEQFSPTLMYPYIREHITSISLKAGVKPILLPPLNIQSLIKNKKVEL